jgi:hypothetical protein
LPDSVSSSVPFSKSKAARPLPFGSAASAFLPVQAAEDHQMNHDAPAAFELQQQAFADAAGFDEFPADECRGGGVTERSRKRMADAHAGQHLPERALLDAFEVNAEIGQFGHRLNRSGSSKRKRNSVHPE